MTRKSGAVRGLCGMRIGLLIFRPASKFKVVDNPIENRYHCLWNESENHYQFCAILILIWILLLRKGRVGIEKREGSIFDVGNLGICCSRMWRRFVA